MSVALQTDTGEGVWYVTFALYNLLDEEIDLKIRKISGQMEGGALGRYLEGRGGGRKECGGRTEMGGRSCKLSGVLDPMILVQGSLALRQETRCGTVLAAGG